MIELPRTIVYRGVKQHQVLPFPLPTRMGPDSVVDVYRWTAGPIGAGERGPIRTTFEGRTWIVYWHDHQGFGPTLEAAQESCNAACVCSAKRQLLYGLPEADRL